MNRIVAHIFSVIGHPMLILTYALLIALAVNPQQFGFSGMADKRALLLMISVVTTTVMLPGLGVALLKPLGFIKSLQMGDKQERIGPYIIAGVFYLWLYKNLSSGGQTPSIYLTFVLGATIALFFNFFINIFTKISAHAAGMGGFIAMILLMLKQPEWVKYGLGIPVFGGVIELSLFAVLALVILLAGMVGTARLALNAHIPADLYRGYAAGFAAVLLASMIG
ncbi:MAG: hypothetical protein KA165_17250 [Saprospiraceae bacterium]|nr:hypothetical protein [Saprospiraceae bacterium]